MWITRVDVCVYVATLRARIKRQTCICMRASTDAFGSLARRQNPVWERLSAQSQRRSSLGATDETRSAFREKPPSHSEEIPTSFSQVLRKVGLFRDAFWAGRQVSAPGTVLMRAGQRGVSKVLGREHLSEGDVFSQMETSVWTIVSLN